MRFGSSIPRQFTLLGTLGVLFTLIALGIGLRTSYDIALQARKAELSNLVASITSTAAGFATLANEGKMTTAQAQQEALTAIAGARFDGEITSSPMMRAAPCCIIRTRPSSAPTAIIIAIFTATPMRHR